MSTADHTEINRPLMDESPPGVERFMVAVVFVFSSGLFDERVVPDLGFFRVNDAFVAFAAGFGVSLAFTKFRSSLSEISHRSLALIFMFYLFVGISIFWSHSPTSAIARYVGFSLTTLWTLYIATRFTVRDLLLILLQTLTVIAAVSVLVSIALPELGQMPVFPHKGDWKGLYGHKNTAGRVMTVLVFVATFSILFTKYKQLGFIGLVLGAPVLYFSGSRTAGGLALLAVAAILLLFIRKRPWLIMAIILGATFVGLSLTLQAIVEGNPLLQLGDDSIQLFQSELTFTGRFGLWQFGLNSIVEKPWFGYGFDGFWKVRELGGQILYEEGWVAADGHNGYLDTVLQTGLVGLALHAIVYFFFLGRGVRRLTFDEASPADLFATVVVFVFLIANLTESYLLKATSIFQLLFTYSLVLLSMPHKAGELSETEDPEYDDEDLSDRDDAPFYRRPKLRNQSNRFPSESPSSIHGRNQFFRPKA